MFAHGDHDDLKGSAGARVFLEGEWIWRCSSTYIIDFRFKHLDWNRGLQHLLSSEVTFQEEQL